MLFTYPESENIQLLEHDVLKTLLGGKGAGLLQMRKLGINVPPFVCLSTEVWARYKKDAPGTMAQIEQELDKVFTYFSTIFGYMPLLSVRSGARASMPGMMDTILNVGLLGEEDDVWEKRLGVKCAMDSAKRLVTMFGNVVKEIPRHDLEHDSLNHTLQAYNKLTLGAFPQPRQQVLESIEAVFKSWDNERAIFYRQREGIPDSWGTAVTLQAMVFGNMNDASCTGVMFTRDPNSGENSATGEFLVNAQGEDVVAGIRTPDKLENMQAWNLEVAEELLAVSEKLEIHNKDVQDIEFTVQDGKLYILQTRSAKRTNRAAVRIATELVTDGILTPAEALKSLTIDKVVNADVSTIDPSFKVPPIATGIPACSGVVTGQVVYSSKVAAMAKGTGKKIILVTKETTPDDIAGMDAAVGILTMTGGSTSHAAVVARGMNRTCVVGVGADLSLFPENSIITLCGSTGCVWKGEAPIIGGDKSLVEGISRLMFAGHDIAALVSHAPTASLPHYWFDIAPWVHCPEHDLMTLLFTTLDKSLDRLTVYCSLVGMADPVIESYSYMLYPSMTNGFEAMIKDKLNVVLHAVAKRAAVQKKTVRVSVPEKWVAPALHKLAGVTVIPEVQAASALALAGMDSSMKNAIVLEPKDATVQEKKAVARITGWLKAEGVGVLLLNEATVGGVAVWSVAAEKFLGS